MDISNSIRLNPLENSITTDIANACEIITATMTLIEDLMSNKYANSINYNKQSYSEQLPKGVKKTIFVDEGCNGQQGTDYYDSLFVA